MTGRPVTIEGSGRRLAGLVFEPVPRADSGSRPGILFIHGYGSDQVGYAPRADAAASATGGAALTFDLGGHGLSDGRRDELAVSDHLRDVLAAYDLLAGQPGVDGRRIGVCGASLGGRLATVLAVHRPVSRLLLRAPALLPEDRGRAPASLAQFTGPVTVVESSRDDVVLRPTIEAYLEACGGRARHLLIDSGHALADPAARAAFLGLIVDWCAGL